MCGICGFAGKVNNSRDVLKTMMDKIAHRGPDDEGMYVDNDVAIGHRRLSIIDLSHGAQPMYNETGDIAIVFNGEIYNHLEIRKDLIAKGHTFANDSDTECLIHRNLIKKIIGLNIMDTSIFLFLASKGYIFGRVAPIVQEGVTNAEAYINPVPSGLVLTGIVVSVSVSAFSLALVQRLYKKYKTIYLDEILVLAKKEEE